MARRRGLFIFIVTARTRAGWIAGASGPYDWSAPGMLAVRSEFHARASLAAIKEHFRRAAYGSEESALQAAHGLVESLSPRLGNAS